jgi:hypothetical protein
MDVLRLPWEWRSEKLRCPAWADIEAAIRRLDRFHYPFLTLWATEEGSPPALDGSSECLEVMGGEGAWWVAGTFAGYFQRRIDYPERGEQEVEVWTSDQGFADAERHICRDLETVVRAARHYAEHGGFDPSLEWGDGL